MIYGLIIKLKLKCSSSFKQNNTGILCRVPIPQNRDQCVETGSMTMRLCIIGPARKSLLPRACKQLDANVIKSRMETQTVQLLPECVLTDEDLSAICGFAQKGQVQLIDSFIKRTVSDRQQRIVSSTFFQEDKSSPFVVAALNGHLNVVKYFLKLSPRAILIDGTAKTTLPHFHRNSQPDINIHKCSALFAASVNGHLNVVKYLTKHGASPNLQECCGATAIHAALLYNRSIKIIDHLIRHGADINIADMLGQTPLMLAARKGDHMLSTLKYLLKKGAYMNYMDVNGYSALHHAAHHGNSRIAEELLFSGADPMFKEAPISCKTEEGQNYTPCPLYLAAANGSGPSGDVVRHLLKHDKCTPACEADAYLLLGSSHCETSRRWLSLHVEGLWSRALVICEENKLLHRYLPPIADYGNRIEVKCVAELQELSTATLSLYEAYYQSLIIRERCMGYADLKLIRLLTHRGHVFLNQKKYRDAENVLFRATTMVLYRLNTRKSLDKALFFYDLQHELPRVNQYVDLSYEWIVKMLKAKHPPSFHRYVELGLALLDSTTKAESSHRTDPREVLCGVLSLFATWLQQDGIISLDGDTVTSNECEELGQKFVSQHILTLPGLTLLHFVLSEEFHHKRQTSYHSIKDISLLLSIILYWGANKVINKPTSGGERPLHLAVYLANNEGQLLVPVLLNHGAHLDAVNKDGKTPKDLCDPELESVLFPTVPLPLVCQACHLIVAEDIPYDNLDLPPHIKHLISVHDSSKVM